MSEQRLPPEFKKFLVESDFDAGSQSLPRELQGQEAADILIGKAVSPVAGLNPNEREQVILWFDDMYPEGIAAFKETFGSMLKKTQESILKRLENFPELKNRLI